MPSQTQTSRIAALNDQLRQTFVGGRVMLTVGILTVPEREQKGILSAIRRFNAFTPDNDPYGEHDFGSLEYEGIRVLFKIDYYDTELTYVSPDPADPAVTIRVLTVMLAEEY